MHLEFIPNQLKVLARVLKLQCFEVVHNDISELTSVDCKTMPKPLYFLYYTIFFLTLQCGVTSSVPTLE